MSERAFKAEPAILTHVPLSLGICGPPGGGKSFSALRIATGIKRVHQGPIVLIDTERGRASKYADKFNFMRVDFTPPFRPEDFLTAIKQQLTLKPCCIIVDSLSDEHDGEGGVLDWHDQDVPKMGNNEWAAWRGPKTSRRKLIQGFLQILTPLIFTFRAREKTKQIKDERTGKNVPVNVGWQPVAPLEIVHQLDLMAVLPPRANGVPVWKSDKVGEDFIIKLPSFFQPYIKEGAALDENMGEAFARWAQGSAKVSATGSVIPAPHEQAVTVRGEAPAVTAEAQAERESAMKICAMAADKGLDALRETFAALPKETRAAIRNQVELELKPIAITADKTRLPL